MEKSKRDGSEVSKKDVADAVTILSSIFAVSIMALMFYLSYLGIFHPEQIGHFVERIEQILNPLTPAFNILMQVLVTALIVVLAGLSIDSIKTIWKGRHFLPDVLEGDDK